MSTYEDIIDQIVAKTRLQSAYAKRAAENKPFPVESAQTEFNQFLASLSDRQREALAKVLLQERDSSIHDVLAVVNWWIESRKLELHVDGLPLRVGLSGMGLHGDYVGRVNDWPWPSGEHEKPRRFED